MKLAIFQEQVFFSTIRITIPNQNGTGASIGTGFLYLAPIPDSEDKSYLFLISNRHVFGDNRNGSVILNFHKKKDGDNSPELVNVETIKYDNYDIFYVGHPDENVDLACINVSAATYQNIYHKNIRSDMICDFNEEDLLPGNDVCFVGYPENRYDIVHNLPILRKGYIASIPKVDFNSRKEFVIDAQVFPGSSGSPVFAIVGGRYKLIGVVTQTMIRFGHLQSIPASSHHVGVQQTLGLGIVIKSTCISELVDHAIKELPLRK